MTVAKPEPHPLTGWIVALHDRGFANYSLGRINCILQLPDPTGDCALVQWSLKKSFEPTHATLVPLTNFTSQDYWLFPSKEAYLAQAPKEDLP